MKKVLFVITKSNWGGAQRYVFDLATALPKEHYDVTVALGGTGEKGAAAGSLEKRLTEANVRTLFVRSFARDAAPLLDLRALIELVKLFRTEQPDVVHLNSSKAGGLGAFAGRLAGVKNIMFTSHGLAWDEDRSAIARSIIFLFSWFTFLLCHRVIVLSQENFTRAKALPFCGSKIRLVYNGLLPLSFESPEKARAFLSERLGKTLIDAPIIGAIAELTKNKGLEYLVRAASILKRRDIPFEMYLIGGGEERERLQFLIQEEKLTDCVHLLGFVPEAYRYLKAFDIFALTSVKEGLPYVLLEAGEAGRAVVGSAIPGVVDIVGDSGLLVPPKNSELLAQKLEFLLTHGSDREALGAALHERVQKQFSIAQMVENTATFY